MKHGWDAVFVRESSDKPVQIEFFLFLFELFSLTNFNAFSLLANFFSCFFFLPSLISSEERGLFWQREVGDEDYVPGETCASSCGAHTNLHKQDAAYRYCI